ncbi:hypothetical protein AXX17_AT3G36690 [Arabidopsis thaliana]|uniref:ELMO domain-containing protein n=1 Tax=Arabidopsis thaliana TaxID=3702 RepID=A0A178VCY6_ARATH|nr:hypothetical protein AXX17_AT3G36690 [Arabidopsis thaliana]
MEPFLELINADAEDASCSSTPSWRIKKSLTCVCFNRKRAYERICSNLTPLQTEETSFQRLLKKQGGKRAAWEYPFAVAGVNITFMIMQMLDLEASKPRSFIRLVFLQMLSESEWAFGLLYCVAFVVMDKQWLDKNATYMEFNRVRSSNESKEEIRVMGRLEGSLYAPSLRNKRHVFLLSLCRHFVEFVQADEEGSSQNLCQSRRPRHGFSYN